MAVNPIRWLTSASVTATNGSPTITVTGSVDASQVFSGTAVFISGREPVEAIAGTSFNPSTMVSTITLRENWAQPTTTGAMVTFNTIEGLGDAIRRARNIVDDNSDLQTTFNTLFTSTAATVDIVLNGVTLSVVPYGFLNQQIQNLLTNTDVTQLQTDITALQNQLNTLEADVDADLAAAQASATAAGLSETNAAASAITASTAATNAGNSETAAGLSETNAAGSATSASASASSASTSESNASASETAAGLSEMNAATSATNASNSASSASNSETNASGNATAAANSAISAGNSETNAGASATAADNSATAAGISETNADADRVATLGFRNEAETFRNEAQQAASSVSGGIFFAGDFDASPGSVPPTPQANVGNPSYRISVAGTIASVDYRVGDTILWNGTGYFKRETADVTASSIDAVPATRTINGNALSSNVSLTASDVGAATSAQGTAADNALPASGGNLSGAIQFTPDTGDVLRFGSKSAIMRTTANGGIAIGADDTIIVGSGESTAAMSSNVNLAAEQTYIGSDNSVFIFTNVGPGYSSRRTFSFGTDGEMSIGSVRVSESILENSARVLQNQATQTITRTTQLTEINVWSVAATYTLDESTFKIGDRVIVRKLYQTTPTVTVITDEGTSIILPDQMRDNTVTLDGDTAFEIELLRINSSDWILTVRN